MNDASPDRNPRPPQPRALRRAGRATRLLLACAAAATLVSGCAWLDRQHGSGTPLHPLVTFRNGEIDIQPPVLRYRKSEGPVTISWRLAPRDGVTLADPAVVLEDPRRSKLAVDADLRQACPGGYDSPEGVFNCGKGERANEYVCRNTNAKPGCYKYTMRLMVDGKLVEKDPPIINFMD